MFVYALILVFSIDFKIQKWNKSYKNTVSTLLILPPALKPFLNAGSIIIMFHGLIKCEVYPRKGTIKNSTYISIVITAEPIFDVSNILFTIIFTIYLLGSLRVPGTITWYSASPLLIGKQGLLKNSQV